MRNTFGRRLLSGFLAALISVSTMMPAVNVAAADVTDTKRMDRTRVTDTSRVNDTPIRLRVSKVKTHQGDHEGILPENNTLNTTDTITYMISGRVEGTEQELISAYGADGVELAHKGASYLGYGWLKGTLEYLQNRKAQNLDEDIEIIYDEDNSFAGYAYVTRKLHTATDTNRYVAGATMALYDAIEIEYDPVIIEHEKGSNQTGNDWTLPGYSVPTGLDDWREDERFIGVTVKRNSGSNDVVNVYVEKGYAGSEVMYVKQKRDEEKFKTDRYDSVKYTAETPQTFSEQDNHVIDENYTYSDEINDTADGVWIAKTVLRDNTPILYYSFDNLHVTSNDLYVSSDAENSALIDKYYGTQRRYQHLYGYDASRNVVDITQIKERDFSVFGFVDESTTPTFEFVGGDFSKIRYNEMEKRFIVDDDTVIYHLDDDGNRDSMVDPQTGIAYIKQKMLDENGNEVEKIFVWPVNVDYDASGSNDGNSNGSKTFRKILTNRIATINADTENEYTTGTLNADGTALEKAMNMVLDIYGHPVYYRRSDNTYTKGQHYMDYDGEEYLGWKYTDRLDNENEDAYSVNNHSDLYNGDADDPFDQKNHYQFADQQEIVVYVDTANNKIINGASTVPVPTRDGWYFVGWHLEPSQLEEGTVLNARWSKVLKIDDVTKEKWYSTSADGSGTRMTITFNANGGKINQPDGDQNSTDNILYHRLGESIIIDNVWVSGENTPNDPFDERKVDTVANTASGQHVLTATAGKTGNDVYTDGTPGGMADMLKRVHAGNYIMEEVAAPDGYAKGLPVAVSVYENDQIQETEMVDQTIKVELIKVDAPIKTDYYLYTDGVKQYDSGTEVLKRMSKGQYSYTHVPGATLSLKGTDETTKKKFSDWVKVSSNTNFTKKNDGTYDYIEFDTTLPLILEGIPAGNYEVTEVKTPAGYVTMAPKKITVRPIGDEQVFFMEDDHIKVMIEKYTNENGEEIVLPNSHHARLQLLDSNNSIVDEWNTDDAYLYTGTTKQINDQGIWGRIVSFFLGAEYEPQNMINMLNELAADNPDIATIIWQAKKSAVKLPSSDGENEVWLTSDGDKIEFVDGRIPDSAPEDFKQGWSTEKEDGVTAFDYHVEMSARRNDALTKTRADQVWDVSNGTQMHVSVYPTVNVGQESGLITYAADVMFNYKELPGGAVSYDNTEGLHVIEYIPAGTYKLHEVAAPEGFVLAEDKTFTVLETEDVQKFRMENKRRKLSIAKIAKIGDEYYAGNAGNGIGEMDEDITKSAVIKGAELTLYYSEERIADYKNAFKNNNVPAGVTMKDRWITGSDGVYTADDVNHGQVYRYDQGDYKRHEVTDINNGYYYIVETNTPAYYKTAEVVEVEVTDTTTAENMNIIRVVNEPMPLRIRIQKRDGDKNLAGAMFYIMNKTTGNPERVTEVVTGDDGIGITTIDDIGVIDADGNLEPYTFMAQEVVAPSGYQLNRAIHEFTAKSDIHEGSTIILNTSDGAIADGLLTVEDSETAIVIDKTDFNGEVLPGAKFEMYVAKYDTQEREWGPDGDPLYVWTTGESGRETFYGLTAGSCYLLREINVPNGYAKADDFYFKVNSTGNGIDKIWHDKKEDPYISFTTDASGAVETVKISGRALYGNYVTIEDLTDTSEGVKPRGTVQDGYVILTEEDVIEGHRYRLTEYATFTTKPEGGHTTEQKILTANFIARLNNGKMKVKMMDTPKSTSVVIHDEDGNEIVAFEPTVNEQTKVIDNAITNESEGITVVSRFLSHVGVDHAAVQEDSIINYRVTYEGLGKTITVIPHYGMNYGELTRAGFTESNGEYTWVTDQESGTIDFRTVVNENATGYVVQKVKIGEREFSYINPVAINSGNTGSIFQNTSKLVISSEVKGTHPGNNTTAFKFKVKLTDIAGNALPGAYTYRTKGLSGELEAYGSRTDFDITLFGDDFAVINDLPYNTRYTVVEVVPSSLEFTATPNERSGMTSAREIANASFTNIRHETSERNTFQKDTGYVLSELLKHEALEDTVLTKYGFKFNSSLGVDSIKIFNEGTNVVLYKHDVATGELLDGAFYTVEEIADPTKKQQLEIKDGRLAVKENLKEGAEYRATEVTPPAGYKLGDSVDFTVSSDGSVDTVILQDEATEIKIGKENFESARLAGAELQLFMIDDDNEKQLIAEWTSKKDADEILTHLEVNRYYILHEKKAPSGHAYANDIKFLLKPDGTLKEAYYINALGEKVKDAKREVTEPRIAMEDKQIVLEFSKRNFSGEEVPGAVCAIVHKDTDKEIVSWTSGTEPYVMKGSDTATNTIIAGETYIFREKVTTDGYEYSGDIEFTIDKASGLPVNIHYVKDGKPELYDKYGYETGIIIKEDGSYELDGNTVTVEAEGNAVDAAGEKIAEGVGHLLGAENDNGIVMKDSETAMRLIKKDDDGQVLPGAKFQILDKNLQPVNAAKDTRISSTEHEGNIKKDEALIFLSNGNANGVYVHNILSAGKEYVLREVKAPVGYVPGPDTAFTMPYGNTREDIVVTASNKLIRINFTKTDFAGKELPGAFCQILDENGDIVTDNDGNKLEWYSTDEPKEITGSFEVGKTYYFHEETSPSGYGYSQDIVFTVGDDGKPKNVSYVNEDGKRILHDKDEYPTNIIVNDDGTYTDNGVIVTIDANGNAVDEQGNVHVEGVKLYFDVTNGLTMKDAPTNVRIVKENMEGKRLTGGKFRIMTNDGALTIRAVKDTQIESTVHDGYILKGEELVFAMTATGSDFTGQLTAGRTYTLREEKAPTGHVKAEDVTFTVPYLNQKEPIVVVMKNKPTWVEFSKKDFATSEELPGATCQITDEEGNVVEIDGEKLEWKSSNEPHVIKGELEPGKTYHYHEEYAPDGYGFAEDVVFTVDTEGKIQKIEMFDKPTNVSFSKTAIAGSEEIPGAFCQIRDKDGNVVQDKDGNKLEWTSTDKPHVIVGILKPDTTYYFHEEYAPDGYGYAKDVEFTVAHDGSVQSAKMEDKMTEVYFHKTDFSTSEELPGAKCQVKDKDGNVIDEWISTTEPHKIEGKLKAGETYYYHEEAAPDGYGYAEDVAFVIDKEGKAQHVELKDKPTEVYFSKQDFATSEEVEGALCQILDKDGNVVTDKNGNKLEWTSTKEPHKIEGVLNAGETYYFHEESAPDGYGYAEDIEFKVNINGSMQKVVMKDKKTVIELVKTDFVTDEELPGATCQIIDKDGNVIHEWVSTTEPHVITGVLKADETYTYHEKAAPDGYAYAADIKFTVNHDGSTQRVEMKDSPARTLITKQEKGTTKKLYGGIFRIIRQRDGAIIKDNLKVDGEYLSSKEFEPGETYVLHEVKAPSGYQKADDIVFTIPMYMTDGEVLNVYMEDVRIKHTGGGGYEEERKKTEPNIITPEGETKIGGNNVRVKVGDVLVYNITYKNDMTSAADIIVRDPLDQNVEFVSANYNGVYENHTVTWTFKNVAPGTKGTVELRTKVLSGAVAVGDVKNTAWIKVGNRNEVETETITNPITPGPDKSEPLITGTDGTDREGGDGRPVDVGEILTYEILYRNGESSAADVVIRDPLDEHVEFVSADNGGYHENGTVYWTIRGVPSGQSGKVTLKTRVLESARTPGKVVNTAYVRVGNGHEQQTRTITNPVPEGPTKTLESITTMNGEKRSAGNNIEAEAGEILTYRIHYRNNHSVPARITILDTLDPKVEFVSATSGGSLEGGTVRWVFDEVAAGESGYVLLDVRVLETAMNKTVENEAKVTVGNDAQIITNKVVTRVKGPAKIVTEIQDLSGNTRTPGQTLEAAPGEIITFKINFANRQNRATTVTVTDTLDENLEFVSADHDGEFDGKTVTWTLKGVPSQLEGYVLLKARVKESALGAGGVENTAYINNEATVSTNKVVIKIRRKIRTVAKTGEDNSMAWLLMLMTTTGFGAALLWEKRKKYFV